MYKLILILSLVASSAGAQTIVGKQITIGMEDALHSEILREKEKFWVSLPTSYFNTRFAKTHYPVIYVLDGDANFATISAMARQLSVRNGNSDIPEAIVVGVLNNDRSRDFTPYPSSFWIFNSPSPLENTGGGDRFAAYLRNELIPHIDSLYQTAPYRVLIGHSLGGLAAVNMLINHTDFFNAYIIIDPSMWYDNQKFEKRVEKALALRKFDNVSLYLGIANSMPPGMDTTKLLKDTAATNLHMRSIFQLKNVLKENRRNGLRFAYGYYADDTHMSVPLITEYDGIRFIFEFYRLAPGISAQLFDPRDQTDPAAILSAHFRLASAYLGYPALPPESLINILANTMKDNYLPAKALSLYRMNAINYPDSYGAQESLATCYEAQNHKDRAIEYYQKALKLKDTAAIREKLSALSKKQ